MTVKIVIPAGEQIKRKAQVERYLRKMYGSGEFFMYRVADLHKEASPHVAFDPATHCPVCGIEVEAVDLVTERINGFPDFVSAGRFSQKENDEFLTKIEIMKENGLLSLIQQNFKEYSVDGRIMVQCPNGHPLLVFVAGGVMSKRDRNVYDDYLDLVRSTGLIPVSVDRL